MRILKLTNPSANSFCNTILTKQINNTESFIIIVAFVLSQRLSLPEDGEIETHYLDLKRSVIEPTLETLIRLLPCSALDIMEATEALYRWRVAVANGSLLIRSVTDLDSLTSAGNYIPKQFRNALTVTNKDILPGQIIWGVDKVLEEIIPGGRGV